MQTQNILRIKNRNVTTKKLQFNTYSLQFNPLFITIKEYSINGVNNNIMKRIVIETPSLDVF